MPIHKVPLTVGFSHTKVIGSITLDPELENNLIDGLMYVLSASVVKTNTPGRPEIMELTLLPLPASELKGPNDGY